MKKLNDFIKRRNEALSSRDVDKVMAFHKEWSPSTAPKSREVCEIGMHIAITAVTTLPVEDRRASKQWLEQRGYSSLDDGDL